MPLRAALAVAALAAPALALNPIHESSYSLLPRAKFAHSATLSVGAYVRSQDDERFFLPFSLTLEATPRLELGAGLKTQWGDAENNFPHMVFGLKFMAVGNTSVQADLMVPTSSNSGKGLSLGAHHRFGHGGRLSSRLTERVGFMEALVEDDALMALEGAFYPALRLVPPLSLELGIIASSQTKGFDERFALDLQPALLVHIGRESVVETAVTLGLAGDRKEELRVKVVLIYAF